MRLPVRCLSQMWSLRWLQRGWRSAAVWLRRVPLRDPVNRRNAPALQLLLLYLGLEIPLNKPYILLNARLQLTAVQLAVGLGTDAAITVAAWCAIWRIRQGALKPAIGLFLAVVLSDGQAGAGSQRGGATRKPAPCAA